MSGQTKILLFGATGYIGGSVLNRLLQHPKANTFDITTPVRSPEKAKLLESKFKAKAEIASLSDYDKLESLASRADIVIHTVNSDNLPPMSAILNGLRKAHETTGKVPILIHTSGTGVILELAYGKYSVETVYSDMDVEQIKSIPSTAFHRNVDREVIRADEEGYARTHIITPSIVYGIATGPVFEAGISKSISMTIPSIIKASLDRKRAGVVGPGKSVGAYIQIDDVADMYITLFDALLENPDRVGHGWEGIYYGENGHIPWYDICKAVGQALVDLGVTDDPEPTPFTDEELIKYWGSITAGGYGGTTCRCRSDRARSLGWKPRYGNEGLLTSIKPEAELQWKLAQEKGGFDFSFEQGAAPLLDSVFGQRSS
ncbi:NAD-binding protein [Fomitopsis schrenkii]|uniref:NAD-binding protein n=1 Tax=Fomitopsis schrenkii TaxID=2126942 RepID=S8DPK5_FOMSC|nr:NAD-binding protein [Fomitopsis schrenkii]